MEKLTILEMRECNLLEWLVINSITKKGNVEKIWPEFTKDGKWEIQFLMNGVELPIMKSFKELESSLDEMVQRAAEKIVENKLSDFDYSLDDVLDDVKNLFRKKLGYKEREEWD